MKNKQKTIVEIVIVGLLIVLLLSIVSAKEVKIYKETKLGTAHITIREKPIGFSDYLSAAFEKTTVYKGEYVNIRDSITRLNGECKVVYWEIFIIKDGTSIGLGDVAEYAENFESCNLEVFVQFVTTKSGKHSLESKFRWKGGSTQTSSGTNILTVLDIEPPMDCQWQEWEYFKSIPVSEGNNGFYKIRENKDMDLFDDVECSGVEYMTYCTSNKAHIKCKPGVTFDNGLKFCVLNSVEENCDNPPPKDYKLWILGIGVLLIGYSLIKGGKNGRK